LWSARAGSMKLTVTRLYVTVSQGDHPADAEPIVVVDDPAIAREVGRLIGKRLGVPDARSTRPVVRAIRAADPEGES
jgi:hypothetical protein